jgi:outer membrane lipopolysaccharide assembly protein LptE/RlpB
MRRFVLLIILFLSACGYHLISWNNSEYQTIYVRQVRTTARYAPQAALFQQALNDRCVAMSGLQLVGENEADLILEPTFHSLQETIIATDSDRRIRQVQYTMISSFKLMTPDSQVLWKLDNYRFSDQYEISTTSDRYKNDAASSMDLAFRNIAEMVITHLSIALNRNNKADD